ncbi:hypothetical protein J0X19_22330 [Hymenobacter sp. BT186]|uniref:Uncharacterized protein n=1 Tax=Hymenobacter telluris TaxID=2816474 RepID=A0A939JER7_9BACT|nr:hypothetical protein [Hymenobacter telluris]MBO0360715.1 hypothetical protein [Hymenobacter telluris]MBW3376742.1 hypothetical protein [Hymenobacter norwichensis]
MPAPTLHLSFPLDQPLEQQLRRFLAVNCFVQQLSSLVRDLRHLVRQQLWFEDLGPVLLVYSREGEHIGYIVVE